MPERAPVPAGGEPRFVLGPLTLYAEVATMEAWLERAVPGDELVYATGPALGRDAPAAVLARQWAAEGEVATHVRRTGAGRALEHFMRRREPPVPPRPASARGGSGGAVRSGGMFGKVRRGSSRPALPLPADFDGSDEGRMLAALTRVADAGAACPSNGVLARELALNSRDRAQYLIIRLARANLIRVESGSSFDGRVVTIVATGRKTGSRERARA